MNTESAEQELARLRQENATLKAKGRKELKPVSFKVSEKGAVSIYNLGSRFPTTLYKGQIDRLLAAVPALEAFVATNAAKLTTRDE
jgi:hypothetical protein